MIRFGPEPSSSSWGNGSSYPDVLGYVIGVTEPHLLL
jgi:hypothetical protein